jgi:CHRD domain
MQKRIAVLTIAAAIVGLAACGSDNTTAAPVVSKIVTFKATLLSSNEVPANTSTGTGTFVATLDTSTNVFTYDVTFTGLTTNVTLGHIHGPAAAGVNAGTTINFGSLAGATFTTGATSGTAHGVTTLTAATSITSTVTGDSLKKLLFAGLTYANVHTTQNPGGEIRGQITKQ